MTGTALSGSASTISTATLFGKLVKGAAVASLSVAIMMGGAAVSSAAAVTIPVSQYAQCNGGDDTAGLTAALAALKTGDTLSIPAGVTCRHSAVLTIKTPGVRVKGPGTLLATKEDRSSVWLDADNITLDMGLQLKITDTTKRWNAGQQTKLMLMAGRSGIIVRDVTIDGSAAAGIMISGADNFRLERVNVSNSRADGIHMTNGSYDGVVKDATVRNAGDDGVAVVSYASNAAAVHDIQVVNPKVYANTWGRGVSVVGGTNITYANIYVESSNHAAIYITQTAKKPDVAASWDTYNVTNVKVIGGTLINSNTNAAMNNGAIIIAAAGGAGRGVTGVTMSDLTITDTRAAAPRNVGVFAYNGGNVSGISLTDFTVNGGPAKYFDTTLTAGYSTKGWTVNGVAKADVVR